MTAAKTRKPKKESLPPLLQKLQTNAIFKAIEAAGLDPRQFDLDDSGAEVRVKHKWSESRFIIAEHYVGRYVVAGIDLPYQVYSWDALVLQVKTWLQFVKLDLDTPDLWADLRRETKLLGAGVDEVTENTPFTPDEQKQIAVRLDELAKSVSRMHSLSTAQTQALDAKVDYLVDASRRLGRKDWLFAFIGAIFGYTLAVALPSDSARTLFLTFLRGIGLLYPELPAIDYSPV
jgi:hypothetical protein